MRFSYFGHQRLYQDANEADSAQVAYWSQRNRDDSRKTDLVRRETRRLAYLKIEDQPGESDVVCDDVVGLKLEYWDSRDKQWREEWITTQADGQRDRLPARVKITLTVHDERGKEVPFTTEARIAMQEPLNLRATDAPATTTSTNGTTPKTTTPSTPTPATRALPSSPFTPPR